MAPILTAEDVVRRIAAECACIDERGGVGIRLEPAAAIVRRYGEQFRRAPRKESSARADELASGGDHNGAAVWRRIISAVVELATTYRRDRCTDRNGPVMSRHPVILKI
jgi:hypothetical protein